MTFLMMMLKQFRSRMRIPPPPTTVTSTITTTMLLQQQKCQQYASSSTSSSSSGGDYTDKTLSALHNFKVAYLERGLVRIRGSDSSIFLQGLITNNMSCLEHDCTSLYSMMLNLKGRVLCDLLIYKDTVEQDSFLIETNSQLKDNFIKTLKKYKLRKKDVLETGTAVHHVGTSFYTPPFHPSPPPSFNPLHLSVFSATNWVKFQIEVKVLSTEDESIAVSKEEKNRRKVEIEDASVTHKIYSVFGCHQEMPDVAVTSLYQDPRLPILGWRMIVNDTANVPTDVVSEDMYVLHRYKSGVGEGPTDHIPEKSLPLECNLVFLNGVSFTKGCYIGQELTARSHHTGIIRKRLMPIRCSDSVNLLAGADIKSSDKDKTVGSLRGSLAGYGLALMRVTEAMKAPELYTKTATGELVTVTVDKPQWWPDEA